MTFKWETFFETGIDTIDQDHRGLVELVNQTSPLLTKTDDASRATLDSLLDRLTHEAETHFKAEESLMTEHGIDIRHSTRHRADHAVFLTYLAEWRADQTGNDEAPVDGNLTRFLASWLTTHFLGEDQRLTKQISLIKSNVPAAQAFEQSEEIAGQDPSCATFLAALRELHAITADKLGILKIGNEKLKEAQTTLEARLADRTRELLEALENMERTQDQILQSEKMAAIGQLAAGVAHEINNPVGFVSSNIGSLKTYVTLLLNLIEAYDGTEKDLAPDDPRRQRIELARTEADLEYLKQDIVDLIEESGQGLGRVKKIVQDLKDFSHVNQAEWHDTDINAGLESTLNVINNEIKYKATVTKNYGNLPPVHCIPSQLNQVFMNLLVNAAQAIENKGTIGVATRIEGDEVWVEISDSGKGMSEEVRKRIFEPFYTTKPVGKGTGLGLSISFDIVVNKHGGRFEVDSTPGQGSTFRVIVPVQPKPPAPSTEQ